MKKLIYLLPLAAVFISPGCDYASNRYHGGMDYGLDGAYGEKYNDYGENPFISASSEPVSTFSVDSDGASYSNMRRYVNLGQCPPVVSVRIEEFINNFTFDYPEPVGDHNVSVDSEASLCPWNKNNYLLRIGLKGKTIPQEELPATNYVFLIDVSGSMNSPDKIGILKEGFSALVDVLEARDRVAIVTYAGNAGVELSSTGCDEKKKIKKVIGGLRASGSTNGAGGIVEAYRIAEENFIPGGNNRIILGSDGDFNVGVSSVEALVELIQEKKESGVYLTVIGVGGGNLNDTMMEQLANKGNGTYEYIDCADQMRKVFINERSKFHTIAADCKIQVRFDATVVDSYRLIGYENRMMDNDSFDDDDEDAGEIGVGQTVTALYEIVPARKGTSGRFGSLDVRYKKPGDEASLLIESVMNHEPVLIERASENMRFAAAVTAFGLVVKDSEYKGEATVQMASDLASGACTFDPYGYRRQFVELAGKLK